MDYPQTNEKVDLTSSGIEKIIPNIYLYIYIIVRRNDQQYGETNKDQTTTTSTNINENLEQHQICSGFAIHYSITRKTSISFLITLLYICVLYFF